MGSRIGTAFRDPVNLLPQLPFRIIHALLEARRFRPVGSRPLFLLGECFCENNDGREFDSRASASNR